MGSRVITTSQFSFLIYIGNRIHNDTGCSSIPGIWHKGPVKTPTRVLYYAYDRRLLWLINRSSSLIFPYVIVLTPRNVMRREKKVNRQDVAKVSPVVCCVIIVIGILLVFNGVPPEVRHTLWNRVKFNKCVLRRTHIFIILWCTVYSLHVPKIWISSPNSAITSLWFL